jgi:hypothetical protein
MVKKTMSRYCPTNLAFKLSKKFKKENQKLAKAVSVRYSLQNENRMNMKKYFIFG